MLKILNTILFVACENSDGLMGFYYSHDGYWNIGYTNEGDKTKMECANTCMGMGSCVAINTYAIAASTGRCYHYSNRSHLISSNERTRVTSKAYIKCLGTDVREHCLQFC